MRISLNRRLAFLYNNHTAQAVLQVAFDCSLIKIRWRQCFIVLWFL